MNDHYKGSNGRLLGRLLDQLAQPMAVLDRHGEIIFVNAPLCEMAGVPAAELIGKTCSWQIAADSPSATVLTALAPPASALEGRISLRQLTTPLFFGATDTGQLFVPILDASGLVHCTFVYLGNFDLIRPLLRQYQSDAGLRPGSDRVLVQIRSRWKSLDGLLAMIGTSPAIELAMQRAQLAIENACNLMIYGPPGVGKLELAQGIFLSRLRSTGQPVTSGHCFPVDCRVLDGEFLSSMLEIFSDRLQPDNQPTSQQMILIGVDRCSTATLRHLTTWIDSYRSQCTVIATSAVSATQLVARGADWAELTSRLGAIEIYLPGLADRREDIAALAQQALADACKQADRAQLTLAADAQELLEAYSWPNNLRQLRGALIEATKVAVLTSSVQATHLPLAIRTYSGAAAVGQSTRAQPIDLDAVLLEVEKVVLRRALILSPRNRAQAARLLGISRPRLLRRIEQLGLDDAAPEGSDHDQDEAGQGDPT